MYSYVINRFIKSSYASVPISNRGFKFGDGFFDTILIHNSKITNWDYHSNVIENSMQITKLSMNINLIKKVCLKLITLNKLVSGTLRISLTRSGDGMGFLPHKNFETHLTIETFERLEYNWSSSKIWLSKYKKYQNDFSKIKPEHGLKSVLMRMEALENNCFESLSLDNEGNICECSSSNIFWCKDGRVFTPSDDLPIYQGSMRFIICQILGSMVEFGKYKLDHLLNAQEVFITNVGWVIKSINSIQPCGVEYKNNEIYKMLLEKILQKD